MLFELRSVVVPGNGTLPGVTFEYVPPVPGTYTVEMIDPDEVVESLKGEFTAELEVFEAEPEFSNLQISPVEVDPGDDVTVTVVVTNVGEQEGTFTVDLLINDEVAATQDVTVGAFLFETVSFTVSRDDPGLYTVRIDALTGTFRVLEPEEKVLRLERVTTVPGTVAPSQSISIVVALVNRFDIELSRELVLSVDGREIERREVTVGPQDRQEVRFTFNAPEDPGRHTVDISGITFSFQVALEPIEEAVLNLVPPLDISPKEVFPDGKVTITATVRNSGEKDGQTDVILSINGDEEARQSKAVPGSSDITVSFVVSRTELGRYRVEVEAPEADEVKTVTGTFTVVSPLKLANLKVEPSQVEIGEPVTITVDVTNESANESSLTVSLTVDGAFVEKQEVTVAGGEVVTVTFTFTEDEVDTHRVEVNELSAEFTVVEKPEADGGAAVLIIVIIIVVLVVGGIGIYVYLWRFRGGPPPPVVWERIKESAQRFWNNIRLRIFRKG